MTGHTLRYEPVIQKIHEIGSTLGDWKSLTGTMHLEERPETNRVQGRVPGVLLDFGIHLLDWVRVMLPGEALTVFAKLTRLSPNAPERHAEITLTTRLGLSCQLNIARVKTKRVTHIEIVGTKKRLLADWTSGMVQTFEQENLTSQEILPTTPTIILMLKDFFKALQTGRSVPITGEEGLRAVELAEACHQAAASRQPIYFQ